MPLATTESGDRDRSPIKHIFVWGVGYNAARSLISSDITEKSSQLKFLLFLNLCLINLLEVLKYGKNFFLLVLATRQLFVLFLTFYTAKILISYLFSSLLVWIYLSYHNVFKKIYICLMFVWFYPVCTYMV